MRLVLANPHVHYYGKVVSKTLVRLQNQLKYGYVLDQFIKNKDRRTAFFIDGTRSSFNELGFRFRFFPKFFTFLELLGWMAINRINPLRHRIFFNVDQLDPTRDVLFNISFTTLDAFSRNNDRVQYHDYTGLVVTHLTHYLSSPSKLNAYFKKIPHHFLIAENDLTHNNYFRHYFPEIEQVYHLPFFTPARFKPLTAFLKRKNKCLALGTFSTPKSKDFMEFFGKGTNLQPMRKVIDSNKLKLAKEIDSLMYNFDNERSLNEIDPSDPWRIRLAKKFLPYFFLYKILPSRQSKYLAFDIVTKHNEYRMFTAPEEIIGLPSNNVFEGMSCGTVFVGANDPMYTGLGMRDGVHYVAHKRNDLKDMVQKIQYYQKRPKALQKISENGRAFAAQFQPEPLAATLWGDLEKLLTSFNAGKPEFPCSFRRKPRRVQG